MRQSAITLTPQAKLAYVAQKLGISSLEQMQGSTRAVFDTLNGGDLNAVYSDGDTIKLFENAGARNFPFTNIDENQFEVGEALAVEQIQLITLQGTGAPIDPVSFVTVGDSNPFVLSLQIGNQTVIKRVPLNFRSQQLGGKNAGLAPTLALQQPIVIPPQIRYSAILERAATSTGLDNRVGVLLYGTGVLLNLKNTL